MVGVINSATDAEQLLIELGGRITFECGGVKLYIDTEDEEFFIEMEPGHNPCAFALVLQRASVYGFSPMEEWDSVEEDEDGTVRHWLAQDFFAWEIEKREEMTQAS